MKMTRLEWRYLQRIALDHPYFDTHKLPLTEKEAKAIVEANIKMTGKEFVDSIYAKLGMTRPQEEKKRFGWLRSIGELFTVPPIRKIAIAVLVVVLMTVFFAATPTGRAIAESVIQYIATLFDDGTLVISQSDNETPLLLIDNENEKDDSLELDNETEFIYVNSYEDFIEITGKIPFVLPLHCSELYYICDPEIEYLELHSRYDTPDGKIVAYQIWGAEDSFTTTLEGFSVIKGGALIFYSVEKDGSVFCERVFDDSYYAIASKGNYTVDDIINMINNK